MSIQLVFLRNHRLDFFHQVLNRQDFNRRGFLGVKVLGFVPCVGIFGNCLELLLVRLLVRTFLMFQLIVFLDNELDSWLQNPHLKLSGFGGQFVVKIIGFVSWIGILLFGECKDAPKIDYFLCSNSCFSITTGLILSSKV